MFKSLVEFVSYSDFASRVRKLEKESKANSKSFPNEELEKFLSELISCRHVISRLCALCENSAIFQDFVLQKRDEVSDICLKAFHKSSDNADVDVIHLMKLITFLHRDGLITKSDQLLDSILKLLTSFWLPPQTALLSGNTVLTILLKKSGQDPTVFHQLFKNSLQFSDLEIFQLSLLTGFMSVVPIQFLLYLSPSREENSAEYQSHLLEYLPGILYYCQQSSPLTFQHFYLLKLFAAKVKDSADHLIKLRIGDGEAVFDKYDGNSHVNYEKYASVDLPESQTGKYIIDKINVDKVLSLCIGNVENQCKGIPDLCSDIYRSILASCQINWTSADFKELLENIIQSTLKSKWTQKSKYFKLQLLVPIIGITESATRCTDLGPGLATSLAANYITHAGIVIEE